MSKSLTYFQSLKLPAAVAQLFKDLDIPLNLTGDGAVLLPDLLEKNNHPQFGEYVSDIYWIGQLNDNAFEGIESSARELQQIRGKNYDTILVFAIEINRENGLLPTRTQLFDLARAFNREFPYQPVVLVFRYGGHLISIAVVERNDYQVKHLEGDKIGKMSLLRDVDTREKRTHAGHLRILRDLQIQRSGKNAVTTFETLYKHWQQSLNVSILNKKFYQELSNWYFWAIHKVSFPSEPTGKNDDELLKTHRANNVIRLITRLVFTWFLKEKKLVPNAIFDLEELTADYLNIASLSPDRSESSEYYLAILQNLFFATLNQEMNERRFKTDTKVFPHPDHSIKNIYRHTSLFKNAERAATELFKNIPFLNGGLFECLDDDKKTIDGFSETKAKQPSVPNFLFFQKDVPPADELNEDYGTKGKKYEVRGLINILNDYKFTIAENTPLEEEVALDPELLGRIFENLLASYNPETKNTARKQTGSFYTPREIVNYMVDESLIAYLKNKLTESHAGHLELGKTQVALFGEMPNKKGQMSLETQPNASRWAGRDAQLEQNLRILFSSTDSQPFEESRDVEDLIIALDQCKILDPACGSGAFPMGILHRMVALLHKLDPQNNRWRKRQIKNAERIEDSTARAEAVEAIERAFKHNELDYGRKLFLIENCIYGVDIQPIAVQIAKLRFFISLICDQNADDAADNRGILSLPNLETKFVAANTLIGLENATLAKQAVVDLLDERETLHHRMFSAKKYADKKRFREKDEKLRIQIKEKLESTGWVSNDVSNQLSNWNPFDQNDFARFFDPQWMFGIDNGFDIVIGNPPYGGTLSKNEVTYFKSNFKLKTSETAILFIEKGVELCKKNGVLSFIVPKSLTFASNYKQTRSFMLGELSLLVDCGKAFDQVLLEAVVFQIIKGAKKSGYRSVAYVANGFNEISIVEKNLATVFDFFLNGIYPTEIEIAKKINSFVFLKSVAENSRGEMLQQDLKSSGEVPVIGGKEISRQGIKGSKGFVLKNKITEKSRIKPRSVLVQNIIAHLTNPVDHIKIICCIPDKPDFAILDTINQLSIIDKNYSPQLIWSILNSKVVNWYAYRFIFGKAIRTMHFDNAVTDRIPIPKNPINKPFEYLYSFLLHSHIATLHAPFYTFENVLNSMVCELYFPDLMKEKEVDIFAQVERDLVPYADFEQQTDAEKAASIETLHRLWTHPDSVVRNRLALMPVRSPDVLGVILDGM
jgi:adenine-specific DNA-methyltransferase